MIKFKMVIAVGVLFLTAAASAWVGVQLASGAEAPELRFGRQEAPIGCG